jgi:hypothetical protein
MESSRKTFSGVGARSPYHRIEPVLGKEPVIGGPVHGLSAAGGCDHPGDRMPPQAHQRAQGKPFGSLPDALLSAGGAGFLPEGLEFFMEAASFF